MNPFSGLFAKILGGLALIVGLLGSVFIYGKAKKADGRQDAEHEQLEGAMDAVKDKAELDRELDDADARERLRDEHYRD